MIFSDLFGGALCEINLKVVCIDIALSVMVHDVEISPSLTTNNRWNSQSFETNDAWKTVFQASLIFQTIFSDVLSTLHVQIPLLI